MPTLELLAPAQNAEFGQQAITHGADAVYIGGPAFGARSNAGNDVRDIEALVAHAHRFHARVLVALNTILRDDELEPARRIAWQVHEAGADALIIQDMGLLELDLPPIQLHASTQTDIRTPEKARFLAQVGFSQLVLARELNLDQIRAIAVATPATLEFFVHGALCVSYSGQCYISHAHTGRSANRGECSQACRLPYDLADGQGQVLARGKHLLSLKDNNQSANLLPLAQAGIRSFKIEGRLKDLSYVKNLTAYYRQTLDQLMTNHPEFHPASAGTCAYTFTPQPDKTFHRGGTDYFVQGRTPEITAFDTPKFSGEWIGEVQSVPNPRYFEALCREPLNNGDGLSFYTADGELTGLRVNRVEQHGKITKIFPAETRNLPGANTKLYRNRDQAFEQALAKDSAQRKIRVRMRLRENESGITLELQDEQGITAQASLSQTGEPANQPDQARQKLTAQLDKLGTTDFLATDIALAPPQPRFFPASVINQLRRDAVANLIAARAQAYQRPPRAPANPATYPEPELTYLGNVHNQAARAFYTRHGVELIAQAFEANQERDAVPLMITKHCLRYSFNLCPKQQKGLHPDPLILRHGHDQLTLRFDCKRCEMHVIGKTRQPLLKFA